MSTIKATIHKFYLDIRKPEDAERWAQIQAMPGHGHEHCTWGGKSHWFTWIPEEGQEIELETEFLFENQWNTAPIPSVSQTGLRVFDLAYDYFPTNEAMSKWRRQGHYLEVTEEMIQLRQSVLKCGYCGAHHRTNTETGFCDRCLGSEHLKAEELYLLRLRPICDERLDRPALSEQEAALILPLYREAQRGEGSERAVKQGLRRRKQVDALLVDAKKKVEQMRDEVAARHWCLDRGLIRQEDNLIFYPHTGIYCFGWREPLKGDDLSQLLEHVGQFGRPYEIKAADGRTLRGSIEQP